VKLMGCWRDFTQWQRNKKDLKYMELKSKLLKLQGRDRLSVGEEEKKFTKGFTTPF
jgi:hypothetical protein